MSEIATARINTFGTSPKADFESPSEEPLFVFTSGQLREIISQAVQKAIEPLQDRIEDLEKMVAAQGEQIATLTSTQEQDVNRICLDIAYDRRRLATLEQRPSTPAPIASAPKGEKTIARIAKIDEVLKSRGPTTLKELERILGIDKATMTRLLGKLDMRRYELHSRPGDDREKVLRLKVQIR
jgi:Fic family protein